MLILLFYTQFDQFDVEEKDTVQVYDGTERAQAIRLHPGQGFSGANPPTITLTADSGSVIVRFSSDPLRNSRGWKATFSAGNALQNIKYLFFVKFYS